ncbi:hypothetical protein M4D79_07695 [Mycolicibacterium novocastrense]|nr:hypothetical protein M4D79_07695 [Mycolicibacterium novocastrense]
MRLMQDILRRRHQQVGPFCQCDLLMPAAGRCPASTWQASALVFCGRGGGAAEAVFGAL